MSKPISTLVCHGKILESIKYIANGIELQFNPIIYEPLSNSYNILRPSNIYLCVQRTDITDVSDGKSRTSEFYII